jgi:hypothetical protein
VSATARRLAPLWIGVLAPPLAWATQLVAAYGAEEIACGPTSAGGAARGSPDPAIVVISALALAVTVVAGLTAMRAWRRLEDGGVERFLAGAGVAVSLLFGATIVLNAIPLLAFDGCAGQ